MRNLKYDIIFNAQTQTMQCYLKTQDPLKIESESKIYEPKSCPHCGKVFKSIRPYQRHIRAIHDKIKWSCDKCELKFNRQDNLKRHIEFVHEGSRYTCNYCQGLFIDRRQLQKHSTKEHHGEEIIYEIIKVDLPEKKALVQSGNCPHCGIHYDQRLWRHIKAVHGEWTCEVCGKKFGQGSNLNRHVRSVHRGEIVQKNVKLFCNRCDKIFDREKRLKRHLEIKHESKVAKKFIHEPPKVAEKCKNRTCSECGKTFKRGLRKHIQ